jgi:hypothetical protein
MSTEQLIADAMALPLAERVSLVQALWESIDAGLPDTEERAAVNEAIKRDEELSSRQSNWSHPRKSCKRRGARSWQPRSGEMFIEPHISILSFSDLIENAPHFAQVVLAIPGRRSINISCLRHSFAAADKT